jgi:hypothetical protein
LNRLHSLRIGIIPDGLTKIFFHIFWVAGEVVMYEVLELLLQNRVRINTLTFQSNSHFCMPKKCWIGTRICRERRERLGPLLKNPRRFSSSMYLLRTAHLGEVEVSVWPKILKDMCAKRNIHVLE